MTFYSGFVDEMLTRRIWTLFCGRRLLRKIFKQLNLLLLGSLLTVAYLMYTKVYVNAKVETFESYSETIPTENKTSFIKYENTSLNNNTKVALETLQVNPRKEPVTNKNVRIKKRETSKTLKYYPDHKAHDYPFSVLPDPYIIRNAKACRNMSDLKYIVIVISASNNFNQRKTIRQTWGNLSYYKQDDVKVVFILGRPSFNSTQKVIDAESRSHQDIVQGKFLDTYRNLTHKSVLGIRWVNEHCLNSRMVVKVDDDVVVNLFQLVNIMTDGECCHNHSMDLLCHPRPIGSSEILRNGSDEKWIIDDDYFPTLEVYPFPYCDGLFSLIPPNVIPILYETATHMPYFWIEDVFLTGILVSQTNQNIQHKNLNGIIFFEDETEDCFLTNEADRVFIAGLSEKTETFRYIWSFVLKHYHKDRA